jgi:hypothetical protein
MRGAPTSTILIAFHIKHISPVRNHIFKSLCQFPFVISGYNVLKPLHILKFYRCFGSQPHLYKQCQSFLNFHVMTQAFTIPPLQQRVVQCARLRNFPLPQINSEPRHARMCHPREQKDTKAERERDPQRIRIQNGTG